MMLLYALLVGICLGVLYDGLFIFRLLLGDRIPVSKRAKSTPTQTGTQPQPDEENAVPAASHRRPLALRILLFVEDMAFALIACFSLILLFYYTNDGQIRVPALIGMVGGFFVYRCTLGHLVRSVAQALVRAIRRLLRAIGKLLWKILRFLVESVLLRILGTCFSCLAFLGRCLWHITGERLVEARRRSKTRRGIERLTKAATQGFETPTSDGEVPRKKSSSPPSPPA